VALRFGEFELDLDVPRLHRRKRTVELPGRALAVLAHLARHRDRIVPRDELIDAVWRSEAVTEASLDQAVKRARAAVGDDGAAQAVIRTWRGRGYGFVAPCEDVDAGRGNGIFVGRAGLLERADARLSSARGDGARMLLLSGEAGIGKSRTATEIARRAERRGAQAWFGRGVELGAAPPYWLWAQVLRRALSRSRTSPTRELSALLGEAMPELGPLLPHPSRLQPPEPARDAIQALFRLAGALVPALRAWSEEVPLVLVLDDLHRVDLVSLRLLEIVASELLDARIAWIGSHREAELRDRKDAARCITSLARMPSTTSFRLEPLGPEEVGRLAREVADREVSASLAGALHRRSGGNPFFLLQLLELHGPRTPLERVADAPASALPETVRAAIRMQIETLDPPARALLDLAAVAGRECEASILSAASGRSPDAVGADLEAAVDAGVLRREGDRPDACRFAHGLVAEALLDGLGDAPRRAMHAALADALEDRADARHRRAEIAEHRCLAALPGDGGLRAVEACRRAADDARRRVALDDAIHWSRRALALLESETPRPGLRLELLQELGEALLLDGQVEVGQAHLPAAGSTVDTTLLLGPGANPELILPILDPPSESLACPVTREGIHK